MSRQGEYIAFIATGPAWRLPDVEHSDKIASWIHDGLWTKLNDFPVKLPFNSLAEIDDEAKRTAYKSIMLARLALIQPVLQLGWNAFTSRPRGAEIAKIAKGGVDGAHHSAAWLRKLCIKYWRSGGNPLSLLPDYSDCGSPTRLERIERARNEPGPLVTPKCPGRYRRPVFQLMGVHTPQAQTVPHKCTIPLEANPVIIDAVNNYLRTPEHRAIIENSLHRWKGPPWTHITRYANRYLKLHFSQFHDIEASTRQVSNIAAELPNVIELLRSVFGDREVDLNHRAHEGDYMDHCPFAGHTYETDLLHTDIHLVDEITRLGIGRPEIILNVDRYSSMATGVYVTTDNVCFSHYARSFHCAFSNKAQWCEGIGLNISTDRWPCEGKPEHIVADGALATNLATVLPEYTSDLGIARPFRGDDKGQVEASFMLLHHGYVHLYGGGVTKGPKRRTEKEPAKSAYVSLRTFTQELVKWVAKHVVSRALRHARRALGPEWRNFKKGSEEWNEFFQTLCNYQFTRTKTPASAFEDTLYDLTQGVPFFIVTMFRIAQRYAITIEAEDPENAVQLDDGLLRAVYEDFFRPVHPMIEALRSGDSERIAMYQDINLDQQIFESEDILIAAAERARQKAKILKVAAASGKKVSRVVKAVLDREVVKAAEAAAADLNLKPSLVEAMKQAMKNGQDPARSVADAAP